MSRLGLKLSISVFTICSTVNWISLHAFRLLFGDVFDDFRIVLSLFGQKSYILGLEIFLPNFIANVLLSALWPLFLSVRRASIRPVRSVQCVCNKHEATMIRVACVFTRGVDLEFSF